MKYLRYILENKEVKEHIELNQELMGYMVQHFPVLSKNIISYTKKNMNEFVDPSSLKNTRKNIEEFSRDKMVELLHRISEEINKKSPL